MYQFKLKVFHVQNTNCVSTPIFFTTTQLSYILMVRDPSHECKLKSWFDSEIRGLEPVSCKAEVIYNLIQRIEWSFKYYFFLNCYYYPDTK